MGTDLAGSIRENFSLAETDLRTLAPLQLAYIGDAVYEIIVRTVVLSKNNTQVTHLHKAATKLVCASAQKAVYEIIAGELTEEETGYFKRGRNAKSYTVAKHASVSDYRIATGFEALCGFLYLSGQTERLLFLVKMGIDGIAEDTAGKNNDGGR